MQRSRDIELLEMIQKDIYREIRFLSGKTEDVEIKESLDTLGHRMSLLINYIMLDSK